LIFITLPITKRIRPINSSTVILVENISKAYHLGQIGTGTLSRDLQVWWAKLWGKPNPLLRIGQKDHGNRDGEIVWALKDVNFSVDQGEVLGIIGRNGAGKSTVLKILSRVTAPTSGRVKVKGRITSLLEVGTGFHPELTGRENIYLNGAILGMTKQEVQQKFDEIAAFAEVEKFIDTPVKRYSSGMYVRLAFAVAAHLNSEILIVDEVLAVGDRDFQKKCLGKMGDVAKEGRTVLFVSHNLGSIQRLCSRAAIMDNGRLSSGGDVHTVIDRYVSQNTQLVGIRSDLYNLPMPSWQRRLRGDLSFSKCALINSTNQCTADLKFKEPFTIHLELISNKKFDNMNIGIGIRSPLDEKIASVRAADYGVSYSIDPLQPLRINISINHFHLLPGHYNLLIYALSRGEGDIIYQALVFQVLEPVYQGLIPLQRPEGFLRPDAEWMETPDDYQF